MRSRSLVSELAFFGCAALCAAPVCAQTYSLVDLGTIHGESHAFALANSLGVLAVGSSTDAAADFQALLYDPAPSGVPRLAGFEQAVAFDVNDSGRSVGTAYNLTEMTWRAFATQGGVLTDLGPFAARGINSAGDIAGTASVVTSTFGGLTLPRACRWHAGALQVLPTLGGQSSLGLAIDESGRVAGSSFNTGDAASRPCLWVGSTANDLGTLGGTMGQVYALRDTRAVGASTLASGLMHATLWTLSESGTALTRTDLGALPATATSVAHAINGAGDVVGESNFHAVLWRSGQVIDLNSLISDANWVLENAWDIDDSGRIVGSGAYFGYPRAFMLTPGPSCPCPSDFNCDGGVDGDDVIAYFGAWDVSDARADFNRDGGVDGDDVIAFFGRWDAGC